MTLDDVGPGVTTQRYYNNGRLIMLEANCIKFPMDIQNSRGIILCKFHAFQSKTEGMAASVRVFLEYPSYLFILCAEVLAITNNKKIKGIKINNKEFILTQYADDTSIILDGSEESLNEPLSELENYAKFSGLKINFSKTHVVWIGSKKYSTDSIKTKWKLNWGVDRFILLGITFDTDLDKMFNLNFIDRISNI